MHQVNLGRYSASSLIVVCLSSTPRTRARIDMSGGILVVVGRCLPHLLHHLEQHALVHAAGAAATTKARRASPFLSIPDRLSTPLTTYAGRLHKRERERISIITAVTCSVSPHRHLFEFQSPAVLSNSGSGSSSSSSSRSVPPPLTLSLVLTSYRSLSPQEKQSEVFVPPKTPGT